MGTNYGAGSGILPHFYKTLRSVNGYNLALQAMCNEAAYSSFCRFISIAPQFDSEYNMQSTNRPVNTRNSTTEYFGTNGVHPDTEGYYQIADAVYRDFIRTFCS